MRKNIDSLQVMHITFKERIRAPSFRCMIIIAGLMQYAQVTNAQVEERMAEIISLAAEELAAEEPVLAGLYYEMLSELAENPVRINSGDPAETGRLFFLSEFRARALADYVKRNGNIVSLAEITLIQGFDRETAELIRPFITLENVQQSAQGRAFLNHSLITNLILKTDNDSEEKSRTSSDLRLLSKYKFRAGSISGGITTEKDPGESFFTGIPPTPDFLSAYFSWSGHGIVKKVIAGDFSARLGLGSALNTGLAAGYSLTSPGNLSGKNELRPYSSTDENNFFRGAGAVAGGKNFEMTAFLSSSRIDASLNQPTDSSGPSVRNLLRSGNHVSASELAAKDAVTVNAAGLNLSLFFSNLRSGLTVMKSTFSIPLKPDSLKAGNLNDFSGKTNGLVSFYYNISVKKMIIAGEISSSGSDGYAFVKTLSLRPVDRLNINVLYRDYSSRYQALHGRGPGPGTPYPDESSIGGSFTLETARYLFASAGTDLRQFNLMSYRNSFPSSSVRHELKVSFSPPGQFTAEAIYQFRKYSKDTPSATGLPVQTPASSHSARLVLRYNPTEIISFVTRADFRKTNPPGSRGNLLLQDMIFRFHSFPVSLWLRYCIFNTGGFESGIYTYENDLLHSFSIPVLYGKGSRSYILIKYEPSDNLELRFKYGITSLSGNEEPENYHDEIKLQLNARF